MASGTIQETVETASPQLVMTPGDLRQVYRCPQCNAYLIGVPLIEREHGHVLPIRCFTYRKDGRFYAECLDLNLITRGESEEEAIGRLQEEMFAYVHAVLDGGPTKGLLPRRAPLWSWIHYYLYLLKDRLVWTVTRRHIPTRIHETFNLGNSPFIRC